jgi:cytochrome c heme-lyase
MRFQGRPTEPTPKARFMSFFGLAPRPFDRHDWFVKRGEGDSEKVVRYVIDYYEGRDLPGVPVFHVDCRPAIDDFGSLIDRIKYSLFY